MVRMCGLYYLLFSICPLISITEVAADDVADLVTLLKSDQPKVRYDAARSLNKFGAKAKPAIKPLIAALKDDGAPTEFGIQILGPRVRDAASDALVRIGRPAVPALIEALSHKNNTTREMAARTLGELGPLAKNSISTLTKTLDDPEDEVRCSAIGAIVRVGAEPKVVVPLLEQVFRSSQNNDFIRVWVPYPIHGVESTSDDFHTTTFRSLQKIAMTDATTALMAAVLRKRKR